MKSFGLEDRFVDYAVVVASAALKEIKHSEAHAYYAKQVIRSSGSSALNFGEMLGAQSDRDFINKGAIVLKELKESRIALRILGRLNDEFDSINQLISETEQLVRITSSLIQKRRKS